MNLKRHVDEKILKHFGRYKQTIILLGARQVGKTTLLKRLFPDARYLLVDNDVVRGNLERYDISYYKELFPLGTKELIIDEIHLLTNPGRAAKIIYDQAPEIKLIITGSSSLFIKNKTGESMAGRKIDYYIYPLTLSEYLFQKETENKLNYKILENIVSGNLKDKIHLFDLDGILKNVLVYGTYPYLVNDPNNSEYLKNLIDGAVFKDLIGLNVIGNRNASLNLLKLLAYQIGSLVNVSELANRLGLNIATVKRYLEIFEQSYIIFPLSPYHIKGRDEIGKMSKYYFYDLGLRNALIDNFDSIDSRSDYGALFENFVISEIVKENYYGDFDFKFNFWRTKQGSEIDLVLFKKDVLFGVEIKTGRERANKAFLNRYNNAKVYTLTPNNFF